MTRLLLIPTVAALALYAQDAAKAPTAEPAKPAEAAAAPAAEPAKTEAAAPAAPAPWEQAPAKLFGSENMSGSVEVGYRWLGTLYGNENVYRSVVNLGEGPRLFGFDFHYLAPKPGGWL